MKISTLLATLLLSASPATAHQSDSVYVLCRAVMDERPYDPDRDNYNDKEVNANGNSFYTPVQDQIDPNAFGKENVWKVLNCGAQPGIYDAEPRHKWVY